jgi:hypothetical protein
MAIDGSSARRPPWRRLPLADTSGQVSLAWATQSCSSVTNGEAPRGLFDPSTTTLFLVRLYLILD